MSNKPKNAKRIYPLINTDKYVNVNHIREIIPKDKDKGSYVLINNNQTEIVNETPEQIFELIDKL